MACVCITATQEAKMGGLLEPRRSKLQGAVMAPLYSSLDNKRESPSEKQKQTNTKKGARSTAVIIRSTTVLCKRV